MNLTTLCSLHLTVTPKEPPDPTEVNTVSCGAGLPTTRGKVGLLCWLYFRNSKAFVQRNKQYSLL